MALRGTLTHRKTRRLAKALGIHPCYALGVLEALWHVAGEQAPAGDVGRMSDEDLAMEMFHDGDPAALVDALVGAEWLDRDGKHRLIVHDWHIHSDDATDNKLARTGQRYANGAQPRMRRLNKQEREKLCAQFGWSHHVVRTDAHETPLPEPVPEPVPDPEPAPDGQGAHAVEVTFDSNMVAQAVMTECGLGRMPVRIAIEQVARYEIAKGADGEQLARTMSERWREYEAAKARLDWACGPEKFFGDGLWRSSDTWPWKEGQKPKVNVVAMSALDQIRAQRGGAHAG